MLVAVITAEENLSTGAVLLNNISLSRLICIYLCHGQRAVSRWLKFSTINATLSNLFCSHRKIIEKFVYKFKPAMMRYFCVFVGFTFYLFSILACKKSSQNNLLIGKWNIVSDSSSTNKSCNGCFNGSNFIGVQADYYQFTDNGILYIEQSGAFDTATYSLPANDQINIATDYAVNGGGVFIYSLGLTGFNLPLSYPIKNLTYHISNLIARTLTLTISGTATFTTADFPPIDYIQIIHLKR